MVSGYFITTAAAGTNFGRGLAGIDMNGDGFGDLVIGADLGADGKGAVRVVYGQAGGFPATVDLDALSALDGFTITGAADGSEFGWSLANIGDQNGDGRADLAIVARATGTITVLYAGATNSSDIDLGSGLAATVGFTISGLPAAGDVLDVQNVGDFNKDGFADYQVTTSGAAGGTGTVYLAYGRASGADLDISTVNGVTGFAVNDLTLRNTSGSNAAPVGDLNGDAIPDLLLGSIGAGNGNLTVLLGTAASQAAAVDAGDIPAGATISLTGIAAADNPGASVAGGQSVNGDARADLIIGADLADAGGVNSGAVYVVYGDPEVVTGVNLSTLNGTNGFKINGLAAGDKLGTVVEMLGDVSGDNIGDFGLMTASGTLYIVFGRATGDAFPPSFDLATLNGTNGYAITGLAGANPGSLGLVALPSINADLINDIAISSTTVAGKAGQTVVLLGGANNLAALDAAGGGAVDGKFDASALGASAFVGTNITTTVTGDASGTLSEDDAATTGSIGTTTSVPGGTPPSFAGRTAEGAYGALVVNAAGSLWTYNVNTSPANQAVLQALNLGDTLTDTITLAATDNTARTITVTITGRNDAPILAGDIAPVINEDILSITGALTLTDADSADMPSLAGVTSLGTHGTVVVNAAGDGYVYTLTDASLQALNTGQTATDTVTLTADDGTDFNIVVTILGADEGTLLSFDDTDNVINTSFGDDLIAALGGNDTINAGGGNDSIDAGAGDDTVIDLLGDTIVNGGLGNDNIQTANGAGNISGGDGGDLIRTGYQSDTVAGDAGNDVIHADYKAGLMFGNDRIDGGTGDDLMAGGLGVDTFVFRPGDGNDTIATFLDDSIMLGPDGYTAAAFGADFTAGVDVINLVGFAGVNAGNVTTFITAEDLHAVFAAEGTKITLFNVDAALIGSDDFLFT